MSPYAASTIFLSRVFDAGGPTTWGGLSWTSTTPAGTSVIMSVRTGNTAVPDGSWSGFAPIATPGTAIGGSSRFIQYRAQLATIDNTLSPMLSDVSIGFVPVPDTTPPLISGVTATPISLAGSSQALITWTTDELANSRVEYGTTSGALTGVLTNAALVTSHSITLTGLLTNKTYYYRVTSVDPAGNGATAPATPNSLTTPVAPPATFVDTTVADFSAGTPGAATYVSETANGEVILAPAAGAEFGGSALPTGWVSAAWSGSDSPVVNAGSLILNGERANMTAGFAPGRSVEFVATFGAEMFQHAGFVGDETFASPWAIFSTFNTTDSLYARTSNVTNATEPADSGRPLDRLVAPLPHRLDRDGRRVLG